MQGYSDGGNLAVGGVPSWCIDPEHCGHFEEEGKKCGKCKSIPHLPVSESALGEGSRSVWVYFPKGIIRRPPTESDLVSNVEADSRSLLSHHCQGAPSASETHRAAPESPTYPGHSLFQDSLLICKFKNFNDARGLADIYVEAVVDGYSGLAFAKVYPARSAMAATDLMATRVAPFFSSHGVPIEQVMTRKAREYCGIAPTHPYETFLATSHIHHAQIDESSEALEALCEQFLALLQREFLGPALRSRYRHTFESLQRDLDHFVDAYNSARPSLAPGMHDRPALQAFLGASRA